MAKQRFSRVMIGDPYPLVPRGDFQMKASHADLYKVWPIIGPTVEMNMTRRPDRRPAELWELFALCYLQGLENGHSLAADGG